MRRTWWTSIALLLGLHGAALAQTQGSVAKQEAELKQVQNQVQATQTELARTAALLETTRTDIGDLKSSRENDRKQNQESDTKLTKLESTQSELKDLGSLLLTVLVGVGIVAYVQLRRWAQRELRDSVGRELRTDIQNGFSEERNSLGLRFEAQRSDQAIWLEGRRHELNEQISALVTLIQGLERQQYDDALRAIRWFGDAESLQRLPTEIRKLVIQCAILSQASPQSWKDVAWQAAEQIFNKESSESNLSFLYELAASARDWPRGYFLYQSHGERVRITSHPAGFLALLKILRRSLHLTDATAAESAYTGTRSSPIVHYLAHIKNNMGEFDAADVLLASEFSKIPRMGSRRPADWVRVAYSYLLNCSESGKPERGLEAARFSATNVGDPLLQLGVLRLALHLNKLGKDDAAEGLIKHVEGNVRQLPEDGVTLQIRARLTEFSENSTKAYELLMENAERVRSGELGFDDLARGQYFFECLIGEMLIHRGLFADARNQLHSISLKDEVGEALFLIALSYAAEKRNAEAMQFLDRAALAHPRWRKISQLKELYPEMSNSHEPIPQPADAPATRQ